MEWSLALFALALLAYGLLSTLRAADVISSAMAFLGIGVVAGFLLSSIEFAPDASSLELVAEATLTAVLFADASRVDLRDVRSWLGIPIRLLGVGLPLTIIIGTAVTMIVLPGLLPLEAVVLAVCLAPTDAALGQAVVSDERVPVRIRQGLNVESGLNDGICVPLLIVALALAGEEAAGLGYGGAFAILASQIGWGVIAGVVAGAAGAAALRVAWHGTSEERRRIAAVASALLAYGLAAPVGGSPFIAAFVAGITFGYTVRAGGGDPDEVTDLVEDAGALFGAATFLMFGAGVIAPNLGEMGPVVIVMAVLALTVIRLVPVALAMLGSHAAPATVAFLGWFGPRGLASIVFAVIVLDDGADLPGLRTIELVIVATVVLSVILHGVTASPLAARYGAWFEAHRNRATMMEAEPVPEQRPRWTPRSASGRRPARSPDD